MATLTNRPATAVLVIDAQVGVVENAHRREEVIGNIGRLVQRARDAGTPVVWVQHHSDEMPRGDDTWQLVPELSPDDGEPRVEKAYGDSFEDTTLEGVLAERGVGRLIMVGGQTDACVRSTAHGGFVRGYDVTLVSDAHAAEDLTAWGAPPPEQVVAHMNLYWSFQSAPGRTAEVVTTDEVDLRPVPVPAP